MYLTDVLPKATYEGNKHRNTTDHYLPKIKPLQSNSESQQNNIGKINITMLYPSLKKLKKSTIVKVNSSMEVPLVKSKKVQKKALRNSKSVSAAKKMLNDLCINDSIPKNNVMNIISYKHLNRRSRLVHDSTNKVDHYIPDPYIRQIIYRRNPIVKSVNYVKMSVDDYPTKPRQLSVISHNLPELNNHRLLQENEINIFPCLRPNIIKTGEYKLSSPARRKLMSVKSSKALISNKHKR